MKKNWIVLFLLFMSFALVLGSGSMVLAQDDDAVMLEELVVTGSRIKRTDVTSTSPISVLSEEDLKVTGQVTLEDVIQDMPSMTGAFLGKTVNNGNRGQATASLRGLGANRTLVLLNGRRMPSVGSTGYVDLNMIPVGMVERVEILRDGASTTYGSDAIAGVVNVITKRDFQGADFQAQYDVTSEGDGEIYQVSGIVGAGNDRSNVVFGMDYTDRKEIRQGDRGFSKCPIFEDADGSLYCGGSSTSYPGHFYGVADDSPYPSHILDNGQIVPFNGEDHGYNYATSSYMVTPQEVLSAYAQGYYDLVEESAFGSVTLTGELVWTNRQSDQLMAAVGTFWGPVVPASNPYNPTGEDVYLTRRLAETGGRGFTQDASAWRVVTALEGTLPNEWTWDVSFNYSRWVDSRLVLGQVNMERTDTALDPDLCAADPDCPGVWDPFRVDTLTPELAAYITVPHSPLQKSEMKTLQINLTGDLGDFELPGGPIQWAVGYEHRYEEALFQPDGGATLGLIYSVSADRTEGDYTVDELYGEVRIPLLKDAPFADLLAAEISIRRSDYDNLDSAKTNWKYALEWKPVPALRLRTVYAEGFRSPSINELYSPQELSAQQYNDPCVNYGSGANATVTANCQADGLPPDFQLSSNQASSLFGGNPDLDPEESESWTLGVVLAPEASSFTASVDYFHIEITDAIGTAGTNNVIIGCYNSPNFSSSWCDLMPGPASVGDAPHATSPYRDATGAISGVLLTNANLADYETEGIDFAVSYVMEFGGYSSLNLGLQGSYLMTYDYTPFQGADVVEMAGYVGEDQWAGSPATFPEWRLNFNFQYLMGDDWSFSWAPRWMAETKDINADAANADNYADAIWYHDVQASYNYEKWSFTLGVRNLFDEDPPYLTAYDDMNTIQYSYDTAGRYYYARVRYSF